MRSSESSPDRKSASSSSTGYLHLLGVALLIGYVLAGFFYSLYLPDKPRFLDEIDYLKLSYNLVHGAGFSVDGVYPTASRAPVYAYFLAALRCLGADFYAMRMGQFIVLAATILLVARISSEDPISSRLLCAVIVVACYPILFYVGATLYPQTLSAFLFLLALYLNLAGPRTLSLNIATGIAYGLLILAVPTFLLTLVVVLVTAWYLNFIRVRDTALLSIIAFLVVGSWTIRNAVVFNRFVPVSSNAGMNFLMGNNPHYSAMEAASNSVMTSYFQHVTESGFNEFQADEYYKETAFNWIKSHPGEAVLNYLEKTLNFFNIVNGYAPEAKGEVSYGKQVLMAASYLLLLALLGWRLWDCQRFPLTSREKLFLIVYVLSAFTSAIFFTRIRLRIPYDYLIIAVIVLHLSRYLVRLPPMTWRKIPRS